MKNQINFRVGILFKVKHYLATTTLMSAKNIFIEKEIKKRELF